jgi:ATP-dependent DNA ligase
MHRQHPVSVRAGNDLTPRFPLIVEAVSRLRARSIIIDGEAVASGDDGIPDFDRLRALVLWCS